jgi:hypothetical protein
MISLSLPHSLKNQAMELAKAEGISIDQFVAQALAAKIAVLMELDYLEERAKRASREKFEQALANCPYNEIFDVGANLCVRPGEIIYLNLYI